MNNISYKHHFIPEFYQKGFSNNDGKLFAYKKTYESIKEWKPAQILYQENLHTLRIDGKTSVIIEDFYSNVEGEFNICLQTIRGEIDNDAKLYLLTKDRHFNKLAKLMVALQFWRTPCKKELAMSYSHKTLELYDNANDEVKEMIPLERKFIKYLSKRAKKDDTIKILQFLLLPLLTFEISEEDCNLKLYKAPKDRFFFASDRPVIYDNYDELFSFQSFIFPFSKELALIGMKKDVAMINMNYINRLIIKNAAEIVISGSKEQLSEIKNHPEWI